MIRVSRNDYFGGTQFVRCSAPGRVNLLGEHTDYNDGFMLPIATPQRTEVAIGFSEDQLFHIYSATLGQNMTFGQSEHASGFGRYVEGCIRVLEQRGVHMPPLRIHVDSDLPIGAGLSSSAALEVATLRALRSLLDLTLGDVALALIAQEAEIVYAKVNCGVMDQMAASLADLEHMLFLDARTHAARLLPLPAHSELLVIDSGVPRSLAGTRYNERRAECERAAQLLHVDALRDVVDPTVLQQLPVPLFQRARHVVTENQRVLRASSGIDAVQFGQLMNQSHVSLRDDYQVSISELDQLTAALRRYTGVYGARLTGAGFGGACVALCRSGSAESVGADVVRHFNSAAHQARLLIPVGATAQQRQKESDD